MRFAICGRPDRQVSLQGVVGAGRCCVRSRSDASNRVSVTDNVLRYELKSSSTLRLNEEDYMEYCVVDEQSRWGGEGGWEGNATVDGRCE